MYYINIHTCANSVNSINTINNIVDGIDALYALQICYFSNEELDIQIKQCLRRKSLNTNL